MNPKKLRAILDQEQGRTADDRTPKRDRYLITILIDSISYQELQQLWEVLPHDHTLEQIKGAALALDKNFAALWLCGNPTEYEFAWWTGQFGLGGWDREFKTIRCHRFEGHCGPNALTNVPRRCVHHSPNGHEWGYGGSVPADLALDILNHFLPSRGKDDHIQCWAGTSSQLAWNYHQAFKAEVLATADHAGFILTAAQVQDWIETQGKAAELSHSMLG